MDTLPVPVGWSELLFPVNTGEPVDAPDGWDTVPVGGPQGCVAQAVMPVPVPVPVEKGAVPDDVGLELSVMLMVTACELVSVAVASVHEEE